MIGPVVNFVARLDTAYAERSYVTRLKARLLAAFMGLILTWIPLNLAKVLWVQPPYRWARLAACAAFAIISLWALRQVFKGRIERAGNGLAVGFIGASHALLFL